MRKVRVMNEDDFRTEKRKLKECYKLLKAGLISPDDIDRRTKWLLAKYYGVKV